MPDYGVRYTDRQIEAIEKRIKEVYGEAAQDIQKKMDDYTEKFKQKDRMYAEQVAKGKLSQDDYDAWHAGQVFVGKQWNNKRRQILATLHDANVTAQGIVNGHLAGAFAANGNYMGYGIESMITANVGFLLYDEATVIRLIAEDPKLLPEWKIDQPKDYNWNAKKVNTQITQGIIQGESLDRIARRLSDNLSAQNYRSMVTFARTAMTGAQNAGRLMRLEEAEKKGIKLTKEWMATLDKHTRDSHAHLDGQKVPINQAFSNGCTYPGDPDGPPEEVYNCRCTMVADITDYPSEFKRYDNIAGVPIKGMTYDEWYAAKKAEEAAQGSAPTPVSTGSKIPDTSQWVAMCRRNPDENAMLEMEQEIFKELSPFEYDSLRHYTGSAYTRMNGYLRKVGKGRDPNKIAIRSEDLEAIRGCHEALDSHRLTEDMVFRRGTDVSEMAGLFMQGNFGTNADTLRDIFNAEDVTDADIARRLDSMFRGQVGTYFGFTSTSSQWGSGFAGDVEVLLYAPKGTPIASIMSISQYGTEEGEALLRDNVRVVCEKIEESDGHFESRVRMFLRAIVD